MKRIALILGAVLVCGVALFVLLVALVPREALKARIGEQIASWTGRDVSVRGDPEISFFPLAVTLNDVRVSGPDGMTNAEILSMDHLTGTVELFPLVIGRIEIGSFTMVRPLIRLVRDGAGHRNWDFETGAAALQLAFQGDVPLGDFGLEGGTIVYEDRLEGSSERLDSVNLTIDWSSVRNPLRIEGAGIWRGEQVVVTAAAEAPFAYLSGGETPVDLRIEAPPISMIFGGNAQEYPDLDLRGALKVSTPSLRRFASWLGSPIGPGSTLGQASGFGTASVRGNRLSVENAEFTLDGNSASGALNLSVAPKVDIAGTLAFSALDLTPYFAGLSEAIDASDDWRDVTLETEWFSDMDADIRLSANTAQIGEISASNAAASVSLRDGRLEIGLASAVIGDGSVAGDVSVTDLPGPAGVGVEAQIRANEIPFSLPATTFGLPEAVSGTGSLFLDIGTRGDSLGALFSGLGGTGRFSIRDGAVPLFGVADVAAATTGARNPTPGDSLATSNVESASIGISFSRGLGTVERGSVVTSSYSADFKGWIGLLDGTLGLNGTIAAAGASPTVVATGTAPSGGANNAEPIRFTIEGTISAPIARPLALAN
jgi:uncharacterized protein involved in outer membrane biogenesis